MTLLHPRLAEHETAVLHVTCGQRVALVALLREGPTQWRWCGTVSLMNRYDDLSIEYASLVRAPIQEIIVRNQELGAGVGVFVGRLLVLKIVENHLRVVFSAGDTARLAWGTPDQPPPGSGDYLQTVVFGGGGEASRPSRIQVTTNYDVPTGKYRLVRNYDWDVTWQTFLPTPPDEMALVAAPRTDR